MWKSIAHKFDKPLRDRRKGFVAKGITDYELNVERHRPPQRMSDVIQSSGHSICSSTVRQKSDSVLTILINFVKNFLSAIHRSNSNDFIDSSLISDVIRGQNRVVESKFASVPLVVY